MKRIFTFIAVICCCTALLFSCNTPGQDDASDSSSQEESTAMISSDPDKPYVAENGTSYRYEWVLRGKLPNAETSWKVAVYTDDMTLTFDDFSKWLLSAEYDPGGKSLDDFYIVSVETD